MLTQAPRAAERAAVTIARAEPGDYEALSRFHYRAGHPAPPVLTLAARNDGALAGVLVVSMPVLNGPWRRSLWPDVFASPAGHGERARAVNALVRTISRVTIDPRYRAMGIAAALVRAYLQSPLTRFTEAIAAAGAWTPLFAAAGMRALPMPPSRRDERLAGELRRLGVAAWTLVEISCAARQMRRAALRAAIERWARDGKGSRRMLTDGTAPWELAVKAAASLLSRPTAYGFEHGRDQVG